MIYPETTIVLKNGKTALLRSVRPEDAADMIAYMKATSAETAFLLREPDEFNLTLEQEKAFLQSRMDSPRELMLAAFLDGQLAGSCSVMSLGSLRRLRHRCEFAIALYQRFWGIGLGSALLRTALCWAKAHDYEQIQLEVMENNVSAVSLYTLFGFRIYGRQPGNLKYSDENYGTALLMQKFL